MSHFTQTELAFLPLAGPVPVIRIHPERIVSRGLAGERSARSVA